MHEVNLDPAETYPLTIFGHKIFTFTIKPWMSTSFFVSSCKIWWINLFPIALWLPKYDWKSMLLSDFIAGMTIALMLIPQGLAYSKLAGLPVQYGLYSSWLGVLGYVFLGTSKDISIGPTAIMGLMIARAIPHGAPEAEAITWASSLAIGCGTLQMVLGLLRLGGIVEFISRPVITGFINAAALSIAMEQLHILFGTTGSKVSFVKNIEMTFTDVGPSIAKNYPDFLLGCSMIALAVLLQWVGTRWGKSNKLIWLVSTSRNFIVVLISTLLSVTLYVSGVYWTRTTATECQGHSAPFFPCSPFQLTGLVPGGLSGTVHIPKVSINTLKLIGYDYIGVVCAVAFLEHFSIARSFGKKEGYIVDPNQELIASGFANIASSFCSGFPVTGSFSRSAVNNASGAKTPLGGVVTSVMVIIALVALTSIFYWIPTVSLAAIIITAVVPLIELHGIPYMWKTDKGELGLFVISFFSCLLLGLAVGMIIGMLISFFLALHHGARPGDSVIHKEANLVIWKFDGPLTFNSCTRFSRLVMTQIGDHIRETGFPPGVFVIDFSFVTRIDYSGMLELETIFEDLQQNNMELHLVNVKKKTIRRMLKTSVLGQRMGSERFHPDIPIEMLRNLPAAQAPPGALEKSFEFFAMVQSDEDKFTVTSESDREMMALDPDSFSSEQFSDSSSIDHVLEKHDKTT